MLKVSGKNVKLSIILSHLVGKLVESDFYKDGTKFEAMTLVFIIEPIV